MKFELTIIEDVDGYLCTLNNSAHTGCTGWPQPTKKAAALNTAAYFMRTFPDVKMPWHRIVHAIKKLSD